MKSKIKIEAEENLWEITFIDFRDKTYEITNNKTGMKKTLPLAQLKIKIEK